MARESKSPVAKILVMLAIVLLPLMAYVGGYLWGQKLPTGNVGQASPYVRCYRYRWQAAIFSPAAKAESYLSGSETNVLSLEEVREKLLPLVP